MHKWLLLGLHGGARGAGAPRTRTRRRTWSASGASGAHVRTCHLACAKRLPNRSSSPSGALPASPSADYTILPERSAWKKNFTYVDTFLLTWQVSRVSDEGVAVRKGGARLGQRSARAPTIFSSADVAAPRVEPCSGEAAESCFCHRCGVRSTQEMILGSTEPQSMCMFCPAVLPARSIASSCSRAAV